MLLKLIYDHDPDVSTNIDDVIHSLPKRFPSDGDLKLSITVTRNEYINEIKSGVAICKERGYSFPVILITKNELYNQS